jgi:gamma-glutamyltranspeptidase / glutathione hydrolase
MSASYFDRIFHGTLCVSLFLTQSAPAAADPSREQARSMTINRYGIVATSQTLASQAGAAILERGGSAVDAAIAANAALGVIEPMMDGVGGDLFAIVYDAKTKKLSGLNASGWSAQAMSIAALKAKGISNDIESHSIYSVTVPGAVAGWAALHQQYGKLSLAEDLAPAIALAEKGVPVPETDAANWEEFGMRFASEPSFAPIFLPGGKAPTTGEVFRDPDMAHTLSLIAEHGRDGFYRGSVAESILKLSREHDGFLTAADLADFTPEWVDPVSTTYHGWTVWEMPPNGQGVAALSMLNIMERFPIKDWGHNSVESLHIEIEAKKLAYADMKHYVGDPKSGDVPTGQLISKSLASERAKLIQPSAQCEVLPSQLNQQLARLSSDTTYLAVVDRDGNEVSLIQSNAGAFGSGLVAAGTGFVLQDRATGFTLRPGQPNSLAPHKRPLHTIIPGFMEKDGVTIAFGIQSGFNQAQAHAQFVSNIVDFNMDIQAALEAARFNKRDFGGCGLFIENGVAPAVLAGLEAKGHKFTVLARYSQVMGRGNAVLHDDRLGVNFGASDPRADGEAIPEQTPFATP